MSKINKGRTILGGVVILALVFTVAGLALRFHNQPPSSFASPTNMDITINTTWSGNTTIYGTLTVKTGYTLTINSSGGTQITVTADNLVVESGAYISADGKGSAGGAATADGVGTGKGLAGSASMSGGGAGYGGVGGDGFGNTSSGGTTYGSNSAPTANGSGGGGGASDAGGAGGGAIKFVIAGETTVSGAISANGADGVGSTNGSGAGSGGSIYLTTTVLSGAGTITANGGNGVANSGGLGGGGRAALYYNDKSNFSGTITANKGTVGSGTGANGTSFDSPSPVAIYTGGAGAGYVAGIAYFYYGDTTTSIWDGGGTTNNASEAANWVGDTLPIGGNSIIFNDTSTKNCTWDLTITPANFTLDTGYTLGTVTLNQNLTVTNTIAINTNGGKLVDNAKTINFKNATIVDEAYRLTSTGYWKQTASGNIASSNYNNILNSLELASGVTGTLTVYGRAKCLILGTNSTITGYPLYMYPVANNFITQGIGATISVSTLGIYYQSGNLSQGALTTAGSVDCADSPNYTLTMTGNWNIGGNLWVHGTLNGPTLTLDTNGNNLTVGASLLLGRNIGSSNTGYISKILFKTGTHTIGGKIYVDGGSTPSTCYTHGYIDFGSSTVSVGGDLDFRGASVYSTASPATPTINLTGTGAATLYGIVDYTYKDTTYDSAMIGKIPVYNLNCNNLNKTVKVNAGDTLLIGGSGGSISGSSPAAYYMATGGKLSLSGVSSGSLLTFQSATASTAFTVDLTNGYAAGMNYLNVLDSNATSKNIVANNSTLTRTTNWISAAANTVYWTNASGDGKWSTAANWSTGVVPISTDSVVFNDISTANCAVDQAVTVANLTLDTNYAGTVTLSATSGVDLTVTGTITINTNGGKLVDNGRTVNFVNANLVSENNRLTSTGTWNQTANGTITGTYLYTPFNILQIANGVTSTITAGAQISVKKVTLIGNATVTGGALWFYQPANDFITPGKSISSGININYASGNVSQGALTTTSWLVINYSNANNGVVITMTGDWNIGNYMYINGNPQQISLPTTLDTNGHNLTVVNNLSVGAAGNAPESYGNTAFGRILFSTGTHSIGGNIRCASQYSHGYLGMGSVSSSSGGNYMGDFSASSTHVFAWIPDNDLSPYVGTDSGTLGSTPYYVIFTDSANKTAKGYLGAGGLATGMAFGSELFANPGFETAGGGGADVWANWNEAVATGGAIANETTLKRSGTSAAKLTGGGASPRSSVNQIFTVTPGLTYSLSFWTRGDGTNGGNYAIYNNSNAAWLVPSLTTTSVSVTSYCPITTYFTIPSTCTQIVIYLYSPLVSGGSAYFDDVSFKQVTEPPQAPSEGGVHIFSAKDGLTRAWASIDSGFNYGAIASYKIYDSASNALAPNASGTITLKGGDFDLRYLSISPAIGTISLTTTGTNNFYAILDYPYKDTALDTNFLNKIPLYNLTSTVGGKTIKVESAPGAVKTLQIAGNLTLQGASGNLLNFQSTTANTAANLNVAGSATGMNYLSVKDSNASSGKQVVATLSSNQGNNTSWLFLASGNVYWTNGSGDGKWSTPANWSTGVVPVSTDSVVFNSAAGSSPASNCTVDQAVTIANLTLDTGYTGIVTLSATSGQDLTVSGTTTLNAGRLVDSGRTVNFVNLAIGNAASLVTSTGTWVQTDNGTCSSIYSGSNYIAVLKITANKTCTLTNKFWEVKKLILDPSSTITGGYELLVRPGAVDYPIVQGAGAVISLGTLSLFPPNSELQQGVLNAPTTIFYIQHSLGIVKMTDNWTVKSLNMFGETSGNGTVTLDTNNKNITTVSGGLSLSNNSTAGYNFSKILFKNGIHSIAGSITCAGNLTHAWIDLGSSTVHLTGNLDLRYCSFTPGTGTIDFTGASGTTSKLYAIVDYTYKDAADVPVLNTIPLWNLSSAVAGKILQIEAGKTVTVANNLTLAGASGNLLTLNSTSAGVAANLNVASAATVTGMNFLSVQDSNASGKGITAYNSTSVSNNTNWFFGATNDTYWTNGSGDGLWSTAANWSTNAIPGPSSNVYFSTNSLTNCTVNSSVAPPATAQPVTIANLTLSTGYTGIVTLGSLDLTVTNTITTNTNCGKLVDNGRTVNFKNATLVSENNRLTSTGTWKQTVNGTISGTYLYTPFNILEIASGIASTLGSSQISTKKLVIGDNATITGGGLYIYSPTSNDFITPGKTISSNIIIGFASGNVSQGALTTNGNLTLAYANSNPATITMTGSWSVVDLGVYGSITSGSTAVLDTNGSNLTVNGNLLLGYNQVGGPNGYLGKILFKTGTHTIGGKIYVAGQYTHGFIDLGSATINVGGDLDFRNATVYSTASPATPTINLTGTGAATLYGIIANPNPDAAYNTTYLAYDTAMLNKISVYNLNCNNLNKVINVEAGKTLLIGGSGAGGLNMATGGKLSLSGVSSGSLLTFQSATASTAFTVDLTNGYAAGMNYLNVLDSNATSKNIVANNSTLTRTTNWISAAANTVYWTNASGDGKWSTAANWSTGVVPASTSNVYFSSGFTSSCTVDQNVTIAGIITQSGYGGTISFGANTISIGGDCDLRYATVSLGTSVINITANNATFSYPTDLSLNSNNGLNMTGASGQTVVIPGSLTVTTGSNFTPGTSTVKFSATSGPRIIDMVYNPAAPTLNKFYNLTFDGVGGNWQYKPTGSQQALLVDNDLSVVNGIFDNAITGTNKNITIGRDLISNNSGTRQIKFGTSTTWSIAGSVNISGSNLTADFGSSAITVGANWDSSGTNTFTVGTSTVNLNGSGTFKSAVGVDTFYNLTCAANTKTTTLDVTSASIEPQIKSVLTLGEGVLAKTGTNSAVLTLTNGTSNATPLVLVPGSTAIGSGVSLKFMPSAANSINIAGANYGAGVIDAHAKLNGITFKLADNISTTSGINLYADNTITTTVDLNNKNLSLGYLKFGKDTNTGSVNLNAGSGAVTFTTTAGLSVNNNGGAHTLNMGSSTWTLLGNWQLTQGTGSLTAAPQTSTVIFSSVNDSSVYGDNTFYNLKCASPGKHIYFEDAKAQTVTGNLIFAGSSANKFLLNNISQSNPWVLNSQGQATVVYVNVYNSDASVGKTIIAAGSIDGGSNTNWTFTEVGTVYWTGTGSDNNWSNPDNWSVVAVPGPTDSVVFNGSSVKDCNVDTAVSVKNLSLDSGYTGKLTLGANLTTSDNLAINQGTFDAVTFNVTVGKNFSSTGAITRVITMGSSAWNVGGNWDTTGSNITLTPGTVALTMSGNAFTMNIANVIFNSLTFSGTTSALITCSGNFNPLSFISPTIKPSIAFTSTASGNIFNPRGVSFNNLTFSGAAGEWTLQDNLTATGTVMVTEGKFIDNAKSVSFKNANIVNEVNRLAATGAWSQTDSGTITNANISNKFKQLNVAASSMITTFGSDINTDTINFSTGTFKGENYTLSLLGITNPIVTDPVTAFTATSKLAAFKLVGVQSQGAMHLGSNLVTDAVEFYRSTGAIQATGNWDCGNNTVRFYADPAATGKATLTNGSSNYNLTAGIVQLGSKTDATAPAYLNLGSGTHSIGSFAKAYSGVDPVTGILSIEMAAAMINNYSGNLDLTPFTYTCGTSRITFIASTGLKTITTNNKPLYSLIFNGVNTQWQLADNLTLKGSITLSNGALLANSKNLILTGQDIAIIDGNFTSANNSAFYDFTCAIAGKQIKFSAGKTVAVTHEFNISGESSSRIKLLSVTQDTQWNLDAQIANVLLCEVRDSNAIKPIIATRSIDSLNNSGWEFTPTRAWDGGGADNNWSTAANWEDNQLPTEDENVIFDTTSVKNCVVDSAVTVKDFTLDTGYTGTVSIGQSGSITCAGILTLASGILNDSGKTVNFQKLAIADTAGLLTSSGTWTQNATGTINSPNAANKINSLVIAGANNTTTLLSDLYVNAINFGAGIFKGEQYTLNIYGNTNFITASQPFTVGTTLSAIKVYDCLAQGAFQLPNNLTSTVIDWWYRTSGASATGNWDFGNNNARFYTDSGFFAGGSVKMLTNNLVAGDVHLGSIDTPDNNSILDLGSGTHSIKSLSKAYAGTATGSLKLQMGQSALNCTGDINLIGINVIEGTSTLNLIGTLTQNLTTVNNVFSTVNFSGSGPFNINANFTAANATVTESKAINCLGSFTITQGITPATSTVTLNSTGAGNQVSLPTGNSFYNLTIDGLGGAWALASPIGVVNTLTINNGTLTDSGKAVSFKNISIADKANLLVSTATWTQNASGQVKCPNKDSRINNLSICGANNVTTFNDNVMVNTATFGTGTLVGAAKNLYIYGTVNSLNCVLPFTVNSGFSAIYTENHTSQNAFKFPDNLVTDSVYWRADANILAATGNWDFGNNSVTFYTTPETRKEIQMSSFALTCGSLRLGSSLDASYPATLNLGSGTHTISNITKAYSGTTTGLLNLLGGSSKINSSGNIDFTGITFTPSSSSVTMQGGSGQKTILCVGQAFYDLTFDDVDTTWSLRDTLTVQRNLVLTSGSFIHNNKKVVLSGANIDSNITGGFTFYDLECLTAGKMISFAATRMQTVQGTLTITGAEGDNIKLHSQASLQLWYINAAHSAVNYVNVKDCVAQKTIVPANSTDEGNNTGWIIGGKFTFEAPTQNTVLSVGTVTSLRWTTDSGIIQAKLYYSTNASEATPVWKPITVDPISVNPNGQKTSYAWTVPDDISTDCKIKIVAVIEGEESVTLYSLSGLVKIMGALNLTYPTAEGVGWPVSLLKNITWTTTGTIPGVKIYCSTTGIEGTWQNIGETGTNTYYSWKPSDIYGADFRSDNCYIKITDTRYENLVSSVSAYNFMLSTGGLDNLVLTTISGVTKDTLISGSSYQIRWNTGGNVPLVDLSYSVDGATWKDIAKGVSNTDSRFDGVADSGPWIVPHDISDNVLVRVADSSKLEILAQSSVKIVTPFTIVAPVSTNIWLGDANYNIVWVNATGSVVSNVKIEYTTDDLTWQEINSGSYVKTNDLSESWKCPRVSTNTARVRISNMADTTGFAYVESAAFKLKQGNVTMLTPNTQVSWKVGEVRRVEWAKTGEVNQVKLYYCPDANAQTPTWKNVVPNGASLDASVLQYDWTVPNDISDTCSMKVVDASDSQIVDSSDTTFVIKSNIVLNMPNGGQSWVTGKRYDIIWSASGTVSKVKLWYSTNGGTSWNPITADAVDNNGTYGWVIPEGAVSENCLVRVVSSTDVLAYGQSASKFAITLATISVTAPVKDNIWVKGDLNKEIKWVTDGTIYNNLLIEYSALGNFDDAIQISANQQNTGSYLWTVPTNTVSSKTAKIRIKDMGWVDKGYTVQGISDVFEITSPRIDVTGPKVNDRVAIGTDFEIKWAARGKDITTVKIIYSPSGGFVDDIYTVASGLTASSGTYTYTWKDGENWKDVIPLTTAVAAKFRIIDENNLTIYGDSGAFQVVGTYVLTAPASAARLFVSKTVSVNWSTIGTVARAKLSYSSGSNDADTVWYNMAGLKPGDTGYAATIVTNPGVGSYTWTVPDLTPTTHVPNANVYVKIEDPDDPLTFDTRKVTVTYYAVKWKVVDQSGLVGDLAALIVETTELASGTQFERTSGFKSGNTLYYHPSKKYTSVWSRDAYLETAVTNWEAYADGQVKLFDGSIVDTLDPASSNYSLWVVKMPQKLITKILTVEGSYYYDANSDALSTSGWLMQQDTMIPKNDPNSGIDGVSEGYVDIFDEANNIVTTSDVAVSLVLSQNGIFNAKWNSLRANGKLVAGKNYFARIRLMYQGAYIWGNLSFQISGALDIQAIQQGLGIKAGETIVGQLQKTLGVSGEGAETIAAKVQIVADKALSILTAAEKTIPDKITKMREEVTASIKTEVKPHVQSGILTRDTTIKQGDTIDISYRTVSGLVPSITVYDSKERIRLNAKTMVEIGKTGVYVYKVKFLAAWGKGEFTVVCTEPTNGTVDALVMTVTQSNLEDVSGQVSAVLGSTTGISGLKDVADTLNTQFNAIDATLAKLSSNIVGKVTETKDALSNLQSVFVQLESISKQIQGIGGNEGINLEKLYNVSKDKQGDVTYIKNKTQELKAAMDLNQKLMQNVANKPVVQTWFEFK